jgi:plasmid replication initiation protein
MRGKNKSHLELQNAQLLPTEERLKKSVGVIHSSGKLTLVQRKLANVLLYSAYDNLLTKRTHTIPVPIMCAMLGWDASTRVDHLKEALSAIQETRLEFNLKNDGKEKWESMTMLSYAQIENGVCTYRYDEALAEKLYDPAMFAMINLQVQRRIDSAYALNLYENCLRYKDTNTGSTGSWTLEFFREIVGATASYCDDFRLLNRKVIKPAIEKINEVSDIMVSVVYEKQMRSVVGLKFHVREKTDQEKQAIQTTLPGMSFKESIDVYKEIRNTPAFQALTRHGISERLAFAWIQEKGEQVVLDLVAYTEERDAQNLIKTNTRTYLTSLVKAGAEVGQSEYEKQKNETKKTKKIEELVSGQQKLIDDLRKEFNESRMKKIRNGLTLDERQQYIDKWMQTPDVQGLNLTYDTVTGKFKDAVTNIRFEQGYLTKELPTTPYREEDFLSWVQDVKKMNLSKLGLKSSQQKGST